MLTKHANVCNVREHFRSPSTAIRASRTTVPAVSGAATEFSLPGIEALGVGVSEGFRIFGLLDVCRAKCPEQFQRWRVELQRVPGSPGPLNDCRGTRNAAGARICVAPL